MSNHRRKDCSGLCSAGNISKKTYGAMFCRQRVRSLPYLRHPASLRSTSRTPIFRAFPPFLKIFKNFFAQPPRPYPPWAESPRRTLAPSENPGIPRQIRPFPPRHRPKITRKTPPQNPKNPSLTPLHIKKLSKVRSTLLTHPLRGCILEYMRLKDPRRPPHTGRHAQHRPPPKISN